MIKRVCDFCGENEIKDLRSAKDYAEIGAALVIGLENGFKGVYRST